MTGWPTDTHGWELSAPESLVLRDGADADRALAVKLGLMELIARGSVRLVAVSGRNWIGRPRTQRILASGSRPMPTSGPLARIGAAIQGTKEKAFDDGTVGRTIEDVAKTFFGSRFNGRRYVDRVILPALEAQGLFRREEGRLLGFIPRVRWVRTRDGDQRRGRLLVMLDDGERILARSGVPNATDSAAFLALAGSAALLMTGQYPELAELTERLRHQQQSADGTVVASSGGGSSQAPSDSDPPFDTSPTPMPEAGAFDVDAQALGDLDLSAFDGIDSAFDAIDSGVDAGSADGGGGDGGGDGGGGGGD